MTEIVKWSPIACLPHMKLTPSGLLDLDTPDGEIEVITRANAELRIAKAIPVMKPPGLNSSHTIQASQEYEDRDPNLICTITTHRLVFLQNDLKEKTRSQRYGKCIHLSMVINAGLSGKGLTFKSPKLVLNTYAYGEVVIAFDKSSKGHADRDDMHSALERSIARRAWEDSTRVEQTKKVISSKGSIDNKVGVGAILAKNKARHDEAKRASNDAFSGDVEDLMAEARGLAEIINKYVATLDKKRRKEQGTAVQRDEDEDKLTDMLQNMGMTSAVTRATAGSNKLYYHQLARQLADFMMVGNRLSHAGGMITLTDVYCLFNRARGSNLISPDDLLYVSDLLKDLDLGMTKRSFPSGVIVIQSDEYDDEIVSAELKAAAEKTWADNKSGITALDASKSLKIPAILALEQLQSAESLGLLCRDVTLEGVRFFSNIYF